MNYFKITQPTVISFSGGRTSGYMLKKCIEENGNNIPACAHVVFQNTGKEFPETLDFVNECSVRWGVPIVWLEFDLTPDNRETFSIVDYKTASGNGEPFEKLISKGLIPNPSVRICTIEMKSRTMSRYLKSIGCDEITNFVGIRADEPKRWDNSDGIQHKKVKGEVEYWKRGINKGQPKHLNRIIVEEKYAPLRYAGITKVDVISFWNNNDFNLKIDSDYSNCDLCYLKGFKQIVQTMRETSPKLGEWWATMEEKYGNRFRNDRPTYRQMMIIASDQPNFNLGDDDRSIPCNCTD